MIAARAKAILDRNIKAEVDRLQRELLDQKPKGRVTFKWHGLDRDRWPHNWSEEH